MGGSVSKRKIIFTWDDNSCRHYNYIAPLFQKYGIFCTFYVNPGWKTFEKSFLKGYKTLDRNGFEIGSHGLTHQSMRKLSNIEYEKQLSLSQQLLEKWLNHQIKTFAFPHHDYTENMLVTAKKYYLETRNTLPNSIRFSLKSHTTIEEVIKIAHETELNGVTLVFSGHSIATDADRGNLSKSIGYEPIHIGTLEKIIKSLMISNTKNDFCTFLEAASTL